MSALPEAVELTPKALRLRWHDGTVDLPATGLRAACRCGSCRARAERGQAFDGGEVELADATPIGHYALNLVFSDGHERGIYPWSWLRELGDALGTADPATPDDVDPRHAWHGDAEPRPQHPALRPERKLPCPRADPLSSASPPPPSPPPGR